MVPDRDIYLILELQKRYRSNHKHKHILYNHKHKRQQHFEGKIIHFEGTSDNNILNFKLQ